MHLSAIYLYRIIDDTMLETVDNLKGLEVYAPNGIFVGIVDDVILDLPRMRVDGLFVKEANPFLADGSVSLGIPFRWVMSVGDIIILSTFPEERIMPGIRTRSPGSQGTRR